MIKLLTFTSSQYMFNSMPRATNTTASISKLSPKFKLCYITYRSMMRQSAHIEQDVDLDATKKLNDFTQSMKMNYHLYEKMYDDDNK